MYQECVNCSKLGILCDGPNFIAMSAPELLSWCKARKAHLHISNGTLADMSAMPKGTIDRLFAGEHMDFRYETIRPVIKVLVGDKEWSGDPCPDPNGSEKAELLEKIRRLEEGIAWRDDKILHLEKNNASMETLIANTNLRATIDKAFLRKVIVVLGVSLGICLTLIITALIIDRIDPEKGFFWLRSWFGSRTSFKG